MSVLRARINCALALQIGLGVATRCCCSCSVSCFGDEAPTRTRNRGGQGSSSSSISMAYRNHGRGTGGLVLVINIHGMRKPQQRCRRYHAVVGEGPDGTHSLAADRKTSMTLTKVEPQSKEMLDEAPFPTWKMKEGRAVQKPPAC
ncbi:uncharacterized protein LOC144823536 [Lissotriton helveticus]